MYFDGADDYVAIAQSSALNFNTLDFTWECFVSRVGINRANPLADALWCSRINPLGFAIAMRYDGTIGVSIDSTAGGAWDVRNGIDPSGTFGTAAVPLATLTHIALTRSGSTFRVFVNGALDQTFTSSAAISDVTDGYRLGHWHDTNDWGFIGYIGKVRLTSGVARYTAGFTVPTY
jgi:hypothetical protein